MVKSRFYLMVIGTLFIPMLLFVQCTHSEVSDSKRFYFGHDIGDIAFNPETDNVNFRICDSTNIVTRRNGLSYPGGSTILLSECKRQLEDKASNASFTGYIVVRFIVNCEDKTDRFRIATINHDFIDQECPSDLKKEILKIVKNLGPWRRRSKKDSNLDFSKFINFHIENGKIISILQ